jgi:predicted nucleic acid-binding protein
MAKKPRVYIETTIVSYLTARRSTDELRNGQIDLTRRWWADATVLFELFTSPLVTDEASAGDRSAAADRIAALASIPTLAIEPNAEMLATTLLEEMALPKTAGRDALHVAIAATNGMDYLVTWNCRHLANATLRARIESVCTRSGFAPPLICTPQELSEVQP